jgi:TonB family protein
MLSLVVGGVMLAGIGVAQIPAVKEALYRVIPELRFGLAGPTRFVPVVKLEARVSRDEPLKYVGDVRPRAAGGGRGGGAPRAAPSPRAAERSGPRLRSTGDEAHDLVRRAIASQGQVPIFQSEELVIEHLERPEYPEDVRARGVEGKVSVIALVDTLGRVIDAEVMTESGEPQFDRAAESAVRLCRFRPYLESGARHEVYAVFRFAFRLY